MKNLQKVVLISTVVAGVSLAMPWGAITAKTPSIILPATAVQVAADIFKLSETIDPGTKELVEGYAIIHRQRSQTRSTGGNSKIKTPLCYGFFASNAKWRSIEPWLMNAGNLRGLDADTVFNLLVGAVNKWEATANADILGGGILTNTLLAADFISPDNQNEAYFADIDEVGAIGITVVWGVFGGPPNNRRLVEWDMIFDDVDFDWSTVGDPLKMDFDNIATHELGHAAGLIDLYNTGCGEETMYGYSTEGETKKQTLNAGDIAGINKLY